MTVRYDVDGAVATVEIDRPDSLNSLDRRTKVELLGALQEAGGDAGVRAVVLTGAGRAFCVGQDLREHAAALEAGEGVEDTVRQHYNPLTLAIATLPKPVVAAVNGVAAGAGAGLAFAADFRVAADSASFLLSFASVGLSADSGVSWTLQRLVGYGRATALLMLGEPVPADRALEMGMVNAVVAVEDVAAAAGELAGRLAAGPTTAYAALKVALRGAATSSLPAAMEHEADLQAMCGATQDHRSATAAFLAKQRPVFTGR